ncbi:hypothetical protein Gobs_3134 [Geodermatophilus obscurus DSM 43160]|uniref:Uncharacterized protein n=1 Tax=Geodermatophilus obscurus (strain ATCC 25078 / DSM 43160 / JCM 3152 / CCUG 61914 / KCC A-0152 / KCTC 9177 / NBRC 13315 / NRRL B-3577 / G-20) TaxID=526225 RepID=D2S9E0_GEOOG|nr:hypothetical protein Gobs_3134 [Geodermatophilus obscurus DSM 43160]
MRHQLPGGEICTLAVSRAPETTGVQIPPRTAVVR